MPNVCLCLVALASFVMLNAMFYLFGPRLVACMDWCISGGRSISRLNRSNRSRRVCFLFFISFNYQPLIPSEPPTTHTLGQEGPLGTQAGARPHNQHISSAGSRQASAQEQ